MLKEAGDIVSDLASTPLVLASPQRFAVSEFEHAVQRTTLAGALLANQMLAVELARANQQIVAFGFAPGPPSAS